MNPLNTRSSIAREKWSKIVSQWEASGKIPSVWCRENNLCYKSFLYWRNRLKSSKDPCHEQKPHFVELSDKDTQATGITLSYRGFSLAISKEFEFEILVHVLRALEKI
jgi:hypothetical protein